MNEPSVKYSDNGYIQLFSGNSKDAVPFLSVRVNKNQVTLQIPGGGLLELKMKQAIEFFGWIFVAIGRS